MQDRRCGDIETDPAPCVPALLHGHFHRPEREGKAYWRKRQKHKSFQQISYRFAFDVNKTDEECRTPLYLAAEQGNIDAVNILLKLKVDAASESGMKQRHI